MRDSRTGSGFRTDFRRHHALGAGPEADQHVLAGPQLGQAEAPQRFHVDEDVRRALAAGQEAEAAQPVEPLDLRPLEAAGRRSPLTWVRGGNICAGWIAVDSSIEIIAERLVALGALHHSTTMRAPS